MISSNSFKLFKSIVTKHIFKSIPIRHLYICDKVTKSSWHEQKLVLKLTQLSLLDFTAESECYKIFENYAEVSKDMEWACTDDVEPLEMTMEYVPILLRNDKVNEYSIKEELLKNASITENDYFIAPRNHTSIATDAT